ncbi:MAG: DUF669 domain-containing protein, partial [Patescibacteria group bacterium]
MAQLIQAFNAQQYNPEQGSGSLPVGKYPVIVESSEVKPNKENNGGYLQLNLKIVDGPNKGGGGAYRLNLYHSNAQTVDIAHKQLSAVCHVTGVFMVQDSAQLHNIPFIIDVGPQKDPQYTEVKKVFDINGNEPGKAPAQQHAQPAQAQPQTAPQAIAQQQPQQAAAPQQQTPAWGQPAQQAQSPAQAAQPAWGAQPAQAAPQQPAAAPG